MRSYSSDVDQVDPHELVARDRDRLGPCRRSRSCWRRRPRSRGRSSCRTRSSPSRARRRPARPSFGSIDERAVEPLGDVLGQRARRGSGRGAGRTARRRTRRRSGRPGAICPAPSPGTPSISAGWMPWKWIVCGWSRAVDERDPQPLALAARSVGPGDAAVVGPGGEAHAGRDLDLLVAGDELPLAQDAPARRGAASCPSRSRAGSRAGRSRWRRGRPRRRGSWRARSAAEWSAACACARRAVRRSGGAAGRELRAGRGARPHGKRAGAQDRARLRAPSDE